MIHRNVWTGCAAGAVGAAATLVALAAGAPAFLEPLPVAALAVVLGGMAVGAVLGPLGALTSPGTPARGAAGLVLATIGGALGAAVVHRCMATAVVGVVVGAVAGAVLGILAARRWASVATPGRALAATLVLATLGVAVRTITLAPAAAPHARLVVVGLDGGTWQVLDPLLAEGAMPATARLVREGARGTLMSMEPSSSSILWTTIASGRLPEEHGIHDFYGTQNDQLRAARFWEVASAAGERVGIFQWLVTWPPDPLPGFVVPDWLARDARTHPESLGFVKEIEIDMQRRQRPSVTGALRIAADAVANGLSFRSVVRITRDAVSAARIGQERAWYRAGRYAQLALHADVFLDLYRRERPAVAAVVFYGSDALSHAYWKFHEPAAYPDVTPEAVRVYGDTIREYYRRFDGFLGRLLDAVGPDTTVVVVSDHGFHAAQDHLLTVHTDPLIELAGAGDRFRAQAINRQVYLTHVRPGTPEAVADVERAAATLRGLQAGSTRLLDVEATPGERVTVELRSEAIRLGAETITGGARPMAVGDLLTRTTWSGSHDPRGILLARGPRIGRGRQVDGGVLDVAPTLLTVLGYPVGADMDGRVLDDLFESEPAVTTVASYDSAIPPRTPTAGEGADLHERLRALGYVR